MIRICFLFILTVVLIVCSCSNEDNSDKRPRKIVKKEYTPKAIPNVDRSTQKDFDNIYYVWLKKILLDWSQDSLGNTTAFDNEQYKSFEQICKYLARQPDSFTIGELLDSISILNQTSSSAVIRGYYGHLLLLDKQYEKAEQVLIKAIKDLEKSKHLNIHAYIMNLALSHVYEKRETGKYSKHNIWEKKAADSIVKALVNHEFSKTEMRIVFKFIDESFSNDNQQFILDKLKREKGISDWLLKMIEGSNEITYAWRWRGSGWAHEVTGDGWDGFNRHLNMAEENLIQAWMLQPEYPEAATKLITVMMGKPDRNFLQERKWFDRAVAAQTDFQDAYHNYLWGLNPRWGGTYTKMLQFAEECLESKRFDTDIPWFYLKALRDIGMELSNNRWATIFRKDDVKNNLAKLFEGMENSLAHQNNIERVIAQKANVLLWQGQYEKARELFGTLDNTFDMSNGYCAKAISWSGRKLEMLLAEIELYTGPYKDDMLLAENFNYEQNKPGDATRVYKKILSSMKKNPAAYNYLREIIVSTLNDHDSFNVGADQNILHIAASKATPGQVRFLLETGSDVNEIDKISGTNSLHWAAARGNLEICRLLIDHGCDLNLQANDKRTPLFSALQQHRIGVAQFLLDSGAKTDGVDLDHWTPLHLAIHGGHEDIALRLLQDKIDINILNDQNWSPLCLALAHNQPKVAWQLLKKGADINTVVCGNTIECRNESPLYLALMYNHSDIAVWLIQNGADIHQETSDQYTALHCAIEKKNRVATELLIKAGAKVNHADTSSWTPLHRSCKGFPDMVPLLIEHGADPNVKTKDGWNSLEIALWYNNEKAGVILVKNGADVKKQTSYKNYTPLHIAVEKNYEQLTHALIERGADILAINSDGETPLDIARNNNSGLVQILMKEQ